ncbi:MAG TPA: TlpA disulfide reductase family protein [Solirubrobacteraceae bacterium]
MRRALPFLALAALVAILVIGLTQAGGGDDGASAGGSSTTTPKASLEGAPPPLAALYRRANTIEDASVDDLRAQLRELRGHPVVLNAWASWCGPCKFEFPFFQQATAKVGTKVAFLALNVQDNRTDAQRFLRSRPVAYPSLEDGDGKLLREAAGGVRGLPVTVFFDAHGRRSFVHQGGYPNATALLADISRYAPSA